MWILIGIVLIGFVGLRDANAQPVRLSLNGAIAAALENNANVVVAFERSEQALAQARELRSDLLPSVTGVAGYSRQKVNLAANGFQFPGFPSIGDPFNRGDARLEFSSNLVDLPTVR